MRDKTLEFHFDLGSPTTYPAHSQVPRIAQETGATLVWHLMLLSSAFRTPNFFVGHQMFFGQDRLDFVREALAAA